MRSPLPRTLLLSALFLAPAALPARAGVVETVYVPTSTSVLALPTTYSYSSAYYTPTVYSPTVYSPTVYSPTVYSDYTATSYWAPTSYYAPTTYYTTSYRWPRRARTRTSYYWSPTTYYEPTAYYTPTVYDVVPTTYQYVATSADTCATSPPPYVPPVVPRTGGVTSGAATGTQKTMTSVPQNPVTEPGLVDPKAGDADKTVVPPNEDPLKEKDTSPPVAPVPGGNGLGANTPAGVQKRMAAKPVAGEVTLRPELAPRALLLGKVTSAATATPIASAKVILTNPSGRFDKKTFTADADGRFEIRFLPEGDWSIEVEDAAGKAQPYGVMTVSGGRVTDSDGREWTSLNLSR